MTDTELPHPRSQSLLFGYAEIERELAEQFRAGHLHHSLLITGPKSIGKATLAYRFARFVLSGGADLAASPSHPFSLFGPEKPDTPVEGDGALFMPADHGIFKRVAAGSHSDLLSIEPAYDAKKGTYKDEIQADAAREIGDFLSLTAAEGMHRVVVIDAADQLNEKAANALLKSIEEPPNNAYIVIVCHNPLSILPTIRSRCRVIKLHTPGLSDFSAVLSHIAPSIPMADYDALHALAHGSPGYAITVSQYDGVALYRSLLEALAHTPSVEAALALASAMAGKKAADAWGIAKHVLLMAIERASAPEAATRQAVFEGEGELLAAIHARLGLKRLLALRDKALSTLRDTDVLNLDHTQALASLLKAA